MSRRPSLPSLDSPSLLYSLDSPTSVLPSPSLRVTPADVAMLSRDSSLGLLPPSEHQSPSLAFALPPEASPTLSTTEPDSATWLPFAFRDKNLEIRFLQEELYPTNFLLMFLLIICAALACFSFGGGIYTVTPALVEYVGHWREVSEPGSLEWNLLASRVGVFVLIGIGHSIFFLIPRCVAVCCCGRTLRESPTNEAHTEIEDDTFEPRSESCFRRYVNFEKNTKLRPTVTLMLEIGMFLAATIHITIVDLPQFLSSILGRPSMFSLTDKLSLGTNPAMKPSTVSVGAYSVVILCCPLRLETLIPMTIITVLWGIAVNITTYALSSTEPLDSLLFNLLFSFLPILLSIYPIRSLIVSRDIFTLKEQRRKKGNEAEMESVRLGVLLSHVVPRKFVGAVRRGLVVLVEEVAGQSSKNVIRCVHLFFSKLDQCGIGLKLRQAGDAWFALSLPYTGTKGLIQMLRMAAMALQLAKEADEELNEEGIEISLRIRIGIGFDPTAPGLLVVWGNRTKSLDFIGMALSEAIRLEKSSLVGQVHLTRETTLVAVSGSSVETLGGLSETEVGVSLNEEALGQIMSIHEEMELRPKWKGGVGVGILGLRIETDTASASSASTSGESLDDVLSIATSFRTITGIGDGAKGDSLWAGILDAVQSTFLRFSTPASESLSRTFCLFVFFSSIIPTSIQFGDLLSSPNTPVALIAVAISVSFVFFLTFFFLLLLVREGRCLQLLFSVFSICLMILRVTFQIVSTAMIGPDFATLYRVICWDWTFPILHTHLNPLIIVFFLLVPLPSLVVLFLSSHDIDPVSLPYTIDFLVELSLVRNSYCVFVGPLTVFQSLRHQWIIRAKDEIDKVAKGHERLVASRSTLVSSFLPRHIQDAYVSDTSSSDFFGEYESICGSICFVRMNCLMNRNEIKRMREEERLEAVAEFTNGQICAFDDIVFDFGNQKNHESKKEVIKIKSSAHTYLCIIPNGSLREVILLALEFLSVRRPQLSLRIGCYATPIGESISAGIIGEERWTYDVVGSAINTAARLADATLAGEGGDDDDECFIRCLSGDVEGVKNENGEDSDLSYCFKREGIAELKGIGRVNLERVEKTREESEVQ